CTNLSLSNAISTEHLYESITDIEAGEEEESTIKEQTPNSSNNSTADSVRSDQTTENELDSGEWSNESTSPILDELPDKDNLEQKSFNR
ncbi:hypothetical protein CEXT_675571, partial [Caerostris extrusa]